ncbi:serine/threonine protein kinase [Chloracidobacterium thermophilum]|uniref:non-specific serine/threonine protein kinase n=1 Tax=Chloracidobacterium thermophilum (strain B) TaxID=981222 RepID=G2LL81_CHLTF|nr:serine/threonine-protein kinase [Chloracidobacterium thermophilum]AEP13757.1 Protein kinase domain protein [Chloracidobacterium thermophilum B]QUV80212.1 protein kinase [Chloracidobacterium thermophilum]
MIGSVIGTYRVESCLGTGGMGTVYRGVDVMLDRPVAIKVLKPELVNNLQLIERFRTEAVLLAKLNHPNIATLYGFVPIGPQQFAMVMEFLPGLSLDAWLRQYGAMPLGQAVVVFSGILDAIGHAHQHGIIHRDLKPSNVMMLPDGTPKVMDFGIARAMGSSHQTRVGAIVGTLEYMSPEQIQGKEADACSDIYALGILLYEMLTGRVPFVADSEYALLQAHIHNPPPPPQVLTPTIPETVAQVVLHALEKDPLRRFQTAEEFKLALSLAAAPGLASVPAHLRVAVQLPHAPPPVTPVAPVAAPFTPPARAIPSVANPTLPRPALKPTEPPWRKVLTWSLAGFAVFAFLLAMLAYVWVHHHPATPPTGSVTTPPLPPDRESASSQIPAATSPVSIEERPTTVPETDPENIQTLPPPRAPVGSTPATPPSVVPPPVASDRATAPEESREKPSPKRRDKDRAVVSERERRRREALKALDQ